MRSDRYESMFAEKGAWPRGICNELLPPGARFATAAQNIVLRGEHRQAAPPAASAPGLQDARGKGRDASRPCPLPVMETYIVNTHRDAWNGMSL